jgi:enterochelin esterase-like enzyme
MCETVRYLKYLLSISIRPLIFCFLGLFVLLHLSALILSRTPLLSAHTAKESLSSFHSAWLEGNDRPLSPRLARLDVQIEEDSPGAVDEFWHEVSQKGTPLVEPIEGESEHVLVTFLYKGDKDVHNVVVFIDRGLWGDIPSNRMVRLLETDIWYRTFKFRRDARFTYSLSVNDPLTSLRGIKDAVEWLERTANLRLDSLNPRKFPAYSRPVSVVELPGAPPQPWVDKRPGVPKGLVTAHKIKSLILSNERTVWIYTFDGPAYKDWVPTPTILDNLIAEKRIPPLIAVLVSHPNPIARDKELTCSEPFTRFLAEELLPWVRQKYPVTSDPSCNVVGGSSYGGLGAAYVAFSHPEIFGNVLSQSGAFMFSPPEEKKPEWLIRQFDSSPTLPIRFHIDFGLMEDHPTDDVTPNIVMTNRHFRDVLLAKNYWVHYQEFNGGHEYINWRGTLSDGLIALLGVDAQQ